MTEGYCVKERKKIEIKDRGDFKVEGKHLSLSGLVDLDDPVPFALRIGDDILNFAIPFDPIKGKKAKFHDHHKLKDHL